MLRLYGPGKKYPIANVSDKAELIHPGLTNWVHEAFGDEGTTILNLVDLAMQVEQDQQVGFEITAEGLIELLIDDRWPETAQEQLWEELVRQRKAQAE